MSRGKGKMVLALRRLIYMILASSLSCGWRPRDAPACFPTRTCLLPFLQRENYQASLGPQHGTSTAQIPELSTSVPIIVPHLLLLPSGMSVDDLPICMLVRHMRAWCPQRPEEDARSSVTAVADCCELSCVCADSSLAPLEEQPVLLASEPSLQLP